MSKFNPIHAILAALPLDPRSSLPIILDYQVSDVAIRIVLSRTLFTFQEKEISLLLSRKLLEYGYVHETTDGSDANLDIECVLFHPIPTDIIKEILLYFSRHKVSSVQPEVSWFQRPPRDLTSFWATFAQNDERVLAKGFLFC